MGITAVFGFYDCQRWDYITEVKACQLIFLLFSRFSKVFPAFYFKFRCSSPADAADSAPAYAAEAIPAVNLHNTRAGEEHSPLFLIVFRPEADPPVHADCKIDVGFRVFDTLLRG